MVWTKLEKMYQTFNERVPVKHPVFQAAKIAEETGEAIKLVFKLVGFRREEYDARALGGSHIRILASMRLEEPKRVADERRR